MNLSGIVALVGVILLILGVCGLLNVLAVPGVLFIVLGLACMVIAAVVGGGIGTRRRAL